jgi:hypothetical protein
LDNLPDRLCLRDFPNLPDLPDFPDFPDLFDLTDLPDRTEDGKDGRRVPMPIPMPNDVRRTRLAGRLARLKEKGEVNEVGGGDGNTAFAEALRHAITRSAFACLSFSRYCISELRSIL